MLEAAKSQNPDVYIGLSYAKEVADTPAEQMINDAKTAGAYAINPDDRLINKELVDKAHAAGLKVQSWTSYRVEPHPQNMIALGVDTLITDCPLESKKLLLE
jgi:glycerophosphoryl diester phosphodiesterase